MTGEEFTTYTLQNDDQRDVRFDGVLLGKASSYDEEGDPERWTEIEIYRSKTRKLIGHVIERDKKGERVVRYRVHVCADVHALIVHVGTTRVAKEAYAKAGIECIEEV